MKTLLSSLTLLCLLFSNLCWAGKVSWVSLAQDLSHESKREKSLQELKKLPHLETSLKKALDDSAQMDLALRVIQNLNLQNLAPTLVEHLGKDPNGRILNTLLLMKSRNPSLNTGRALTDLWERGDALTTDQKIIFLSLSSSYEYPLTDESFKKWLASNDPDLKIALAKRTVTDGKKGLPNEGWWPLLLSSNPYQVRWEAIAGAAGITALTEKTKTAIKNQCQKETKQEVKDGCKLFLSRKNQ